MWRAILLTLGLMLSLGLVVPLLTDNTEASSPRHYKKYKKYKKYSRQWWRAYHARQRRKKALALRKRDLQMRQETLAKQSENGEPAANGDKARQIAVKDNVNPAQEVLPSGENAPSGWKRDQTSKSELKFRVSDDGGNQIGSASITVVGPATGADSDNVRNKAVGGVSTSALRRTVIDRMMKEDGWVVNDYQKDLGNKKVYVVVAQSKDAAGQVSSRMFYFTEVEGKIYSVATNSTNESSERLAQESEKVITSLQRSNRSVQQAELR